MNRRNNVPLKPAAAPPAAVPPYLLMSSRVPTSFIDAMKRVQEQQKSAAETPKTWTPQAAAQTQPAQPQPAPKAQQIAFKWKSSFKPLGEDGEEEGDDMQKQTTSNSQKDEPYDPYDPGSSDSETEKEQTKGLSHSSSEQILDNMLERHQLPPVHLTSRSSSRWDLAAPKNSNQPFVRRDFTPNEIQGVCAGNMQPELPTEQILGNMVERHQLSPVGINSHSISRWDSGVRQNPRRHFDIQDFPPDTRNDDGQGPGAGQMQRDPQAYSPHTETIEQPVFGSSGRDLDHRVRTPERILRSSSQEISASNGGQTGIEDERIRAPELHREISMARLSPPRAKRSYEPHSGLMANGCGDLYPVPMTREVPRGRSMTIITDTNPVTCDLCDVELANGQELEYHLDSRSHWATLEYVQQNNNYDDLAIAFLQEVMMYKTRQCGSAIEDNTLPALEENEHMTKVEVFHCAACRVFVSTSARCVQTHVRSQEHVANTREFQVQQRRSCLDRAGTIMRELKPQFELFSKGDPPFSFSSPAESKHEDSAQSAAGFQPRPF